MGKEKNLDSIVRSGFSYKLCLIDIQFIYLPHFTLGKIDRIAPCQIIDL
jgi:hypothetical protein